jgi:hypothetical protein
MSTATASQPANPLKMKASNGGGGGSFDLCPAGNYPGHLVAIYDLGTHDGEYKGKARQTRKIFLAWELSGEMKPDGSPYVIGKEYSLSFTEKSNLRLMFEQWRGKKFSDNEEFEVDKALGKPCLVNVTHRTSGDKSYHEIGSIGNLPKGMTAPSRVNDLVMYLIENGTPPAVEWLPYSFGEHPADIAARSLEKTGKPIFSAPASGSSTANALADEDIPF